MTQVLIVKCSALKAAATACGRLERGLPGAQRGTLPTAGLPKLGMLANVLKLFINYSKYRKMNKLQAVSL